MQWFRTHALFAIGGIFFVIGAPFILIGIWQGISSYSFIHSAQKTTGTVTEIISYTDSEGSTMYKPRVSYKTPTGEKEYIPGSGSSPVGFTKGQSVSVYYDPKNPDKVKIDSFMDLWFLSIIFGGLGIVFTGIGVGIIIFQTKRTNDVVWLKSHGQMIQADFVDVGSGRVEVNGAYGLQIICQWLNPTDNKLYVFNSEDMWFDPTKFVNKDKKIPVIIDPVNPHRYYVDISWLPKTG